MTEPPISGDPPNPIDPPSGCRFRTRCAFVMPRCAEAIPPPVAVSDAHHVACYLFEGEPTHRGVGVAAGARRMSEPVAGGCHPSRWYRTATS
jgi:hypothetical protein